MIKNPAQIKLMALGMPCTPCNGGDDSNESNQTTNNYDNRSVITLDAGAVSGAIGLATKVSDNMAASVKDSYTYSDGIFDSALDFANNNSNRTLTAYDRAASIVNDAMTQVKEAYADSKGTADSQVKIIYAVLAVSAVFALSMASNKG